MAEIKGGTIINDRFEVRTYIGGGGFGAVWEGFDKQLKRKIAIKRILTTEYFDKKRESEAISEARKIAPLSNPHIVSIFDVIDFEGEVLIIMEYMSGGSLQERLRSLSAKGTWLALPEAFKIVREILIGLHGAHTAELGPIIHRDLKPLNILFDKAGTAKLADFGLASIGRVNEIETVNPGKWEHPGTFGYKSPEQLKGAELDERSDLFNVGLITYLLFAALHPFTDPKFLFNYKEMVLEPYREIPPIKSKVFEPEIQRFITKLLATSPGARFQKASGAIAELDYIEGKYDEFLLNHVISFYDFLKTGKTEETHVTSEELTRGICLCKKKGFYAQGAFLFEKSGLNLIKLSPHLYSALEEDYRVCRRRAGQEVIPE